MNAQAITAAKSRLGELDAWLAAYGERLKIIQFPAPVPATPPPPAPKPPLPDEVKTAPSSIGTEVDEDSILAFPTGPVRPAMSYDQSDQGHADHFVDLYGSRFRYDHGRNRWLVWRKHRWEQDHKGQVQEAGQITARTRTDEAKEMPTGNDDEIVARLRARAYAWKAESRASRENMLTAVRDRQQIAIHTMRDGWDTDAYLLGVPNGVVDLRTGVLRDGLRDTDKITLQTRIPFDAKAECPRFERFISEIFVDPDLEAFVRRAIGYTLTGDVREDCWFGTTGEGANGKSTLMETLFDILGDYAYSAPFSLVETGQRFQSAYLINKRFVLASEVSKGATIDDAQLKLLTGGDPIPAEWKHGDSFNFLPMHKLWFMFNNKPTVKDTSHGFWRRARLIPFTRTFKGANEDKSLRETLDAERRGILAWLVRACLEWQEYGLITPTAVLQASNEYKQSQDVLFEFLAQHVEQGQKVHGAPSFSLTRVYKLYLHWCLKVGIKYSYGRTNFGKMLEERGFVAMHMKSGGRGYYGKLIFICVCMVPGNDACECF